MGQGQSNVISEYTSQELTDVDGVEILNCVRSFRPKRSSIKWLKIRLNDDAMIDLTGAPILKQLEVDCCGSTVTRTLFSESVTEMRLCNGSFIITGCPKLTKLETYNATVEYYNDKEISLVTNGDVDSSLYSHVTELKVSNPATVIDLRLFPKLTSFDGWLTTSIKDSLKEKTNLRELKLRNDTDSTVDLDVGLVGSAILWTTAREVNVTAKGAGSFCVCLGSCDKLSISGNFTYVGVSARSLRCYDRTNATTTRSKTSVKSKYDVLDWMYYRL